MKFKDAVVESAKEEIRKRKEEQKKLFQESYDQKRIYNPPPEDKINMVKHFYFPKFIGYTKAWLGVSKAALAVYPVLCSRADFEINKWFQCSQENIAKMAGISVNTVAKGINNLLALVKKDRCVLNEGDVEIPLLERKKATEGKRHFFLYRVGFARKDSLKLWKGKKLLFIFHTCIIDSGVWADLSPRAKALYLAMRTKSEWDMETYCSIEEEVDFDREIDISEYYRTRKWDLCELSLAELARLVNISSNHIQKTLYELEHHRLAVRYGKWIKVYLKPRIKVEDV